MAERVEPRAPSVTATKPQCGPSASAASSAPTLRPSSALASSLRKPHDSVFFAYGWYSLTAPEQRARFPVSTPQS